VIVVVLMGIESTAGFTGLRGRADESMDALVAAHGLVLRSKAVRSDDHTDWCEERAAGCARADSMPFTNVKLGPLPGILPLSARWCEAPTQHWLFYKGCSVPFSVRSQSMQNGAKCPEKTQIVAFLPVDCYSPLFCVVRSIGQYATKIHGCQWVYPESFNGINGTWAKAD
jgi:hypothetical protein